MDKRAGRSLMQTERKCFNGKWAGRHVSARDRECYNDKMHRKSGRHAAASERDAETAFV